MLPFGIFVMKIGWNLWLMPDDNFECDRSSRKRRGIWEYARTSKIARMVEELFDK